jgi:hypothetical protein
MTETEPWPDWLAGKTPEQRVRAILNAVAACYGGDDHDQPATQHCTVSVAEMLLLRLLGGAPGPVLAPESGSIAVARDDLSTILADAWMLSGNPEAFNRLAVAAGLLEPPPARAEATT